MGKCGKLRFCTGDAFMPYAFMRRAYFPCVCVCVCVCECVCKYMCMCMSCIRIMGKCETLRFVQVMYEYVCICVYICVYMCVYMYVFVMGKYINPV